MLINPISFRALLYREIIRFLKVVQQTILSPVVSSLLYIAIFGVTLGSHINNINGIPYLLFVIPGIAVMDVIMSSYSNTSSSLFLSRYLHLIDNLLITPISYTELVLSYIIGGVIRGVLVGGLILLVGSLFTKIVIAHVFFFIIFIILICVIFAGLGLLTGLISDEFEHLSVFSTYFITPLTFFGGVFYSIKSLPQIMYVITSCNPFFYIIDGFRWSILGYSEGNIGFSVILCVALAIILTLGNIYLFKKGYKLKQ